MIEAKTCLRYYVESGDNPVRHDFNILIVNYSNEIRTIAQRIKQCLAPTEEYRDVVAFGDIPGTRLKYRLVKLISKREDIRDIEWRAVYVGEVKVDKNLRDRKDRYGLQEYIKDQFKGT